jgi:glycosyltransferase involved in cell wall biosynthesis
MLKSHGMQDGNSSEKKLKVCIVVTKGVWGGAQKYVYNLAVNLSKDLFDVWVITGEGDILKKRLQEKNINVISIKSLRRDIYTVSELKSFFKLFIEILRIRPDILHLNSPKAGGLGSLIGRILFIKKIIYTSHGWTFNEDRPVIQNSLILFFSWIIVFLCHRTIVIAPREEEQIKSLPFINPKKIVMISNGIEPTDFVKKEIARKKLLEIIQTSDFKLPTSALWIGTISELHKNKGIVFAIEALRKISHQFVFVVIGEGEERKNLEKDIEKCNLKGKVFLVGFMDNAASYLRAFDIFVLSSIKEGLPYTILEAGMAELPVIASSTGGIPDIIQNGQTGILTTKGRPGEIIRALEYLIDNPNEREKFAKNLKLKVESEYSIHAMLECTQKIYLDT